MSFEVSVRSARPYSTKWSMFLSDDGLMTRVERKLYDTPIRCLKKIMTHKSDTSKFNPLMHNVEKWPNRL